MENPNWRLNHFSYRSFTHTLNAFYCITDSVFPIGDLSLKRKLFEHSQSLFLARPFIDMDRYCQRTILRLQG